MHGGVILVDGKHQGFAKLAADGVAQAVREQSFAKQDVGGLGEKLLFIAALLEVLLAGLFALWRVANDYCGVANIGQQLGGDPGAGIDHQRIDQKAFAHAVEQ